MEFKVDLIIESDGDSVDQDLVVSVLLDAENEADALRFANLQIAREQPALNLMRTWAWHIERLAVDVK